MSPAEAAIREALESATRCLIESTEHRVGNPRWELAANRLSKVSAELDALRARCEADDKLLRQALDALEYHRDQTRPIVLTDAAIAGLRAHLKGAGQ